MTVLSAGFRGPRQGSSSPSPMTALFLFGIQNQVRVDCLFTARMFLCVGFNRTLASNV
jgi:hypothetical protein